MTSFLQMYVETFEMSSKLINEIYSLNILVNELKKFGNKSYEKIYLDTNISRMFKIKLYILSGIIDFEKPSIHTYSIAFFFVIKLFTNAN